MSEKLLCSECDRYTEFETREEDFDYTVRNTKFTIKGKLAFGTTEGCGHELFHLDYDRENQKKAFDLYRAQEGILSPEQIKEIRDNYGLIQRDFSRLLGFGEITISRYERGSLPTPAQNKTIKDSIDPKKMLELLRENGDKISKEVAEELKKKLQIHSDEEKVLSSIQNIFSHKLDVLSGYKSFDMKKFSQMVLYFAKKEQPYLTKINKLLFYSDFYFYREFKKSISGMTYMKYDHGPVPNRYYTLLDNMDEIEIKENVLSYGVCNYVAPKENQELDITVFSKEELETLEFVYEKFQSYSARDIREFSHEETAWLAPKMKEAISYDYAKELH